MQTPHKAVLRLQACLQEQATVATIGFDTPQSELESLCQTSVPLRQGRGLVFKIRVLGHADPS